MSSNTELQNFWVDPEPLVATIARLFMGEGSAMEVAILANSKITIEQTNYDNWNGGTYSFTIYLQVPASLIGQIGDKQKECEQRILDKAQYLVRAYPNDGIEGVCITPEVYADPKWRDNAKAWVMGDGVNNQGRVRSDNVAAKTADGLLFRSEPEINLYRAFKTLGVSFAPLPVFIRGGEKYQRIEPDFVVIKDGIVMVIEVDGDTVHHESPAEAHARTTMLQHEGAFIERVRASECATPEGAVICAKKLIQTIAKVKISR